MLNLGRSQFNFPEKEEGSGHGKVPRSRGPSFDQRIEIELQSGDTNWVHGQRLARDTRIPSDGPDCLSVRTTEVQGPWVHPTVLENSKVLCLGPLDVVVKAKIGTSLEQRTNPLDLLHS